LEKRKILPLHTLLQSLEPLCSQPNDASEDSLTALDQYHLKKQRIEYINLKLSYLFDIRCDYYSDSYMTLYYQTKVIKNQVINFEPIARIQLYAAKARLIQENFFVYRRPFQLETSHDASHTLFLHCFQDSESMPQMQLTCLK
jgi:hypothetical protein